MECFTANESITRTYLTRENLHGDHTPKFSVKSTGYFLSAKHDKIFILRPVKPFILYVLYVCI